MIQWIYYPLSDEPTELARKVVNVFESVQDDIDVANTGGLNSNQVLSKLRPGLESAGFVVEHGRNAAQRIRIPVLFGMNGKPQKCFDADAYNAQEQFVLEVEAGRGYLNNQFLKDLFEACMMHGVQYVAIAVRNIYINVRDFDQIRAFFDTLYASNRLHLPLQGVLLIGY